MSGGGAGASKRKNDVQISNWILMPILIAVICQWTSSSCFYQFPQLFEDYLIGKFNITTVEVSFLYSIGSVPNLFVNIFAALLVRATGIGYSALIFQTLIFTGVVLTSWGVYIESFDMMIVGRIIFGMGYDTTLLGQSIATNKWFSGRFLTITFSLNKFTSYLFSSSSVYIMPIFYKMTRGVQLPLLGYGFIAFFVFMLTLMFFFVDYLNEYKLGLEDEDDETNADGEKFVFNVSDLRFVSGLSWMIMSLIAIYPQCYLQFMNIGTDLVVKRFGDPYLAAKNVIASVPMISMVSLLVMGWWFGKYGKKGLGLLITGLLFILGYFSMSLLPDDARNESFIGTFFISMGLSMYCVCSWSSLMLSVPAEAAELMIAFGATFQNLLLATLPVFFGVVDTSRTPGAYENSLYMLMGLSSIGATIGGCIVWADCTAFKVIHMPENDPKVKDAKKGVRRVFFQKLRKAKGQAVPAEDEDEVPQDQDSSMTLDDSFDRRDIRESEEVDL